MAVDISHPPIHPDEFADETFTNEEFFRKQAGSTRYVRGGHLAYDMQARNNLTLYAPCDGKVSEVHFGDSLGAHQFVVRTASSGFKSGWFFAHADQCSVANGATVKAGQPVGVMGSSGLRSAADRHLHLEFLRVWNNWRNVSPETAIDPGPELKACKEGNMPLNDDDKAWIRETVREMVSRGIFSLLNGRKDAKLWTDNISQELTEALTHNNKAIHEASQE